MKKALFFTAVCLLVILSWAATSARAAGPVTFNVPMVDIKYNSDTGQYTMLMPGIDINGVSYWGKWQLNLQTRGWDLIGGNQSTTATGQQSAFGQYLYDPGKGIALFRTMQSTFIGDCAGLWLGQDSFLVTVTPTTLDLTDIADFFDDSNPSATQLTRVSGTGIVGTWALTDEGNTFELIMNQDGTFILNGNVVVCNP